MNTRGYMSEQLKVDFRTIIRDPLLKYILFAPVLITILLKFGIPIIGNTLKPYQIDIVEFYPLIFSFFILLIMPSLFGLLMGFSILEDKDEGTILALQVSPLEIQRYLMYKSIIPVILSFICSVLLFPLVAIYSIPFLKLVLISILSSLWGPLLAILLSTVAKNKVQGFALSKIVGLFFIIPIMGYFVAEPYQYLFGFVPTYWSVKAFWIAPFGNQYLYFVAIGFVQTLFLMHYSLKQFRRRVAS